MTSELVYESNGFIHGTPRGYGNKTEGDWKAAIVNSLNEPLDLVPYVKYYIDLTFKINPASKGYRGHNKEAGPDLDNLVKTTIDAIFMSHDTDDKWIHSISAAKTIVNDDDDMGVRIRLEREKRN